MPTVTCCTLRDPSFGRVTGQRAPSRDPLTDDKVFKPDLRGPHKKRTSWTPFSVLSLTEEGGLIDMVPDLGADPLLDGQRLVASEQLSHNESINTLKKKRKRTQSGIFSSNHWHLWQGLS